MHDETIYDIIKEKQARLNTAYDRVSELRVMAEAMVTGDFDIYAFDDLKKAFFPDIQNNQRKIHMSARTQYRSFIDSLTLTHIQIFSQQKEALALWPYHWLFSDNTGIPEGFYNQYIQDQIQRIHESYDKIQLFIAEVIRQKINPSDLVQALDNAAAFDVKRYYKKDIKTEDDYRSHSGVFYEQTFETLLSQVEMEIILTKLKVAECVCVRDRRAALGQSFNTRAGSKANKSFDTSDGACAELGHKIMSGLERINCVLENASHTMEGYKDATDAKLQLKRAAPKALQTHKMI